MTKHSVTALWGGTDMLTETKVSASKVRCLLKGQRMRVTEEVSHSDMEFHERQKNVQNDCTQVASEISLRREETAG